MFYRFLQMMNMVWTTILRYLGAPSTALHLTTLTAPAAERRWRSATKWRRLYVIPLLLLSSTLAEAQTAQRLVLPNSPDGQSELTVYLPTAEAAAGSGGMAVVDCPGGGYSHLSMENEGHNWAEYFNAMGVAYVVTKYRMPHGDRTVPLGDAYNAIRTVRDSAAAWHIDPQRVGIMGFSAGGHLASAVSTHADETVRPNFSILFYPVVSMDIEVTHRGSVENFLGEGRTDSLLVREWSNDEAVDSLTPPAILFMSSDDRAVPVVTNGLRYYAAMVSHKRPAELHAYPTGGHGWGFKETFKYHEAMKKALKEWLTRMMK